MRRRSHAWLALASILVGVSAAALFAQQPAPKDPAALMRAGAQQRKLWATEWLGSDDPQHIAWGASLVRQDRLTALLPLLVQKVAGYQPLDDAMMSPSERDLHDAMLPVLDALITLRANVPVEDAHKLYPEFAAQSVILMVRSSEENQAALLDVFDRAKSNAVWLAAGNILLGKNNTSFARRLLEKFTQHLSVAVVDPNRFGSGSGGGIECGELLQGYKSGWPPVGVYFLGQFPTRYTRPSPRFLAAGPTPVYFWRFEPSDYNNPIDAASDAASEICDGDRDRYRAQYLARMISSGSQGAPLTAYPDVIITWHDESGYRQDLQSAIEKRRVVFRGLVSSIRSSGTFLEPGDLSTFPFRLELLIRDERSDRSSPLPLVVHDGDGVSVVSRFTQPLL